jgi:hypothetical protein
MKASGVMIRQMVRESSGMQMETSTKENGMKTELTAMERTSMLTEPFTRATGSRISRKDMGKRAGQMVPSMRALTWMARSMAKGCSALQMDRIIRVNL